MGLLIGTLAIIASADASNIRSDEHIIFFPTLAYRDERDGDWVVPIHGWVFEPERDSIRRSAALTLLRKSLGLSERDGEALLFQERAREFLVDNERGKRILIRINGTTHALPGSEADGHVEAKLRIPPRSLTTRTAESLESGKWITFQAVLPKGDSRRFSGSFQLLGPDGLSVISDIDDTIKVSAVLNKPALLINTFLREFEAVPGMAGAYRSWAKQGASFHYISASPWQLYNPLRDFADKEGFPAGTFHLKSFRVKDSSFFSLFDSPYEYKLAIIEPILKAFPRRRFVLVGDSSEKDPEVYGQLARDYPARIRHIFIRDVTDEPAESDRYRKAFENVPPDRWRIFRKPGELPESM